MIIRNLQRLKNKKGFTIFELIVVIAIAAVLAAVIVPASSAIIENGQKTNRAQIARTIYVSMQNFLSRRQVEGNLRADFTGSFFTPNSDVLNPAMEYVNLVSDQLASNGRPLIDVFPPDDAALMNEANVRFVSLPRGYVHGDIDPVLGTVNPERDRFFEVLNEVVLDRDVLQNAILMEYNIRTGVVLSIFYGDAGQDEFKYMNNNDATELADINNVTGARGLGPDGYTLAEERLQGYYGVTETGVPPNIETAIDGGIQLLDGELWVSTTRCKDSVLYAVVHIAKPNFNPATGAHDPFPPYTFELIAAVGGNVVGSSVTVNLNTVATDDFYAALSIGDRIYRDNATITEPHFERFVWIIDYVGEDYHENGTRIDVSSGATQATDVRARLRRNDGAIQTSAEIANTHYGRQLIPGTYEVKSARHLHNIRTHPELSFRQLEDIDLGKQFNKINNFVPIDGLSGVYNAVRIDRRDDCFRVGCTNFARCEDCSRYRIENLKISAPSQPDVGLFMKNSGRIQGLALFDTEIIAQNGGILVGENIDEGEIANIRIETATATFSGGTNGGAIAGSNEGLITDNVIRGTVILGPVTNLGGITGENSGKVQRNALEYSRVFRETSGGNIGGIVGNNAGGEVSDVYFLSYENINTLEAPLSYQAGGIVGSNVGEVTRALFISPAPRVCGMCDASNSAWCSHEDVMKFLYPTVRSGQNSTLSFYLAGDQYNAKDVTGGRDYNFSKDALITVRGVTNSELGTNNIYGLPTDLLTKRWIEIESSSIMGTSIVFSNWRAPSTESYKYPVITHFEEPGLHPTTGDKLDIEEVFDGDPDLAGRLGVNLVNANFNEPMIVPEERATAAHPAGKVFNFIGPGESHWLAGNPNNAAGNPAYLTSGAGPGDYNLTANRPTVAATVESGWGGYYHQDYVQGWAARPTVVSQLSLTDLRWRWNADHRVPPPAGVALGRAWEPFEFNKPISGTAGNTNTPNGRARRNYDGSMDKVYIELNAQIPSTIYSINRTEDAPAFTEQKYYYAFHHLTRNEVPVATEIRTDRMNFYLTKINEAGSTLAPNNPDGRYHAGYSGLTMIRPAHSPRNRPTGGNDPAGTGNELTGANRNNRFYNVSAARTVEYTHQVRSPNPTTGALENRALRILLRDYWEGKSQFEGYNWDNTVNNNIYLYDVWIGSQGSGNTGSRTGFGITFWTNTAINTANLNMDGYATMGLLAAAVTNANLNMNGITPTPDATQRLAEIEKRIIGYWDVAYGWKKYYGLYEVEDGQAYTEFAFQSTGSATNSEVEGNYLAGIEFDAAPSFMTVISSIKRGTNEARFVEPGDVLTIEHLLENKGEVPTNRIKLTDRVQYHVLLNCAIHDNPEDPLGNTCRLNSACNFNINATGRRADGSTFTVAPIIQPPTADVGYVLTVEFPSTFALAPGESILISYNVQVRYGLMSEPGLSTWFYPIRLRGELEHYDRVFPLEHLALEKDNVSPIAHVDISQIQPNANITLQNGTPSRINGPFRVTLTIENEGEHQTRGYITADIPKGFNVSRVRSGSLFPKFTLNETITSKPSIEIDGVNLNPVGTNGSSRVYTFDLEEPLGLMRNSIGILMGADARYWFSSNIGRASLKFPPEIIAITTKATNLEFEATPTRRRFEVIDANYNGLPPEIDRANSYDVTLPQLVLTNANGDPLPLAIGNVYAVMGTTPAGGRFRIEQVQNDSAIVITPNQTTTDGMTYNTGDFDATVYYRIEATASRGADVIDLSSQGVNEITVSYRQ
ncbi:MAG: prepilin-type N-terminal cleavage/methylation domain-containing protein [Oscillospiraceae bacterium]|nr:prepilin-type N-terminal cleavage/methylation domain-containing protein [Oscillospiraceae bacterium]